MGGGWNYKRLQQLGHKYKNQSHKEEQQRIEGKDKFPNCRGNFDTCPSEEELKSALEKKMAPAVCGNCPVFEASKVAGIKIMPVKPRMSDEDLEFYKKMMGK